MPKPPNVAASHRNSVQLDQTVALTNYETNSTERVETWEATSGSPHNVSARVDLRSTPRVIETVRESGDAEVDGRVYLPDDASGVSSIRDGGGKGASTVDEDEDGTDDWRVIVLHDEQNGLVRLDCERID